MFEETKKELKKVTLENWIIIIGAFVLVVGGFWLINKLK